MKDLAICIPAYNRKECLIELLSTIVTQLTDDNRHRIQICVSDDCSPTDLGGPSKDFMENYDVEYIFYRNPQNIAVDRNFLKSAEISDAKYCWLVGDDDGIPPGKIDVVLKCIDENPTIDVFFGNRYICDRNLKIRFEERWTNEKSDFCVDFTKDDEIEAYFDRLTSTTALGYLTTLIVKKEVWDSVTADDYEPYIGTIYIQVSKYIMMLYGKGKLYRITDFIALSRFGYDNFFSSLKQRVFMDFDGFLRLAAIFENNQKLKGSFLGIVRRHYNNIFLHAMSYSAPLSTEEIEKLKKLGYSKKQLGFFEKRSRFKSLFSFGAGVIKTIFVDFWWFRKTCMITMQKFIRGGRKG